MNEDVAVVVVGGYEVSSLVDAVGRTLCKKAGAIMLDVEDHHIYVVDYSLGSFRQLEWAISEMVDSLEDLHAYDQVEVVVEVDGKHVATTASIGDCAVE